MELPSPEPTPAPAPRDPEPDARVAWGVAAALFVGTFLLYARSLAYPFVNFDDPYYLWLHDRVTTGLTADSVRWAFTTGYFSNWHPLTWLSYQLDATLFGPPDGPEAPAAAGFRAVNLLLHAGNAALLFGVLRAMTGATWRSAAVAGLWALHPLRVESVVWVSERKDVLSTLFWLLATAAYLRYSRGPSVGRYLLVAVLLALGLMCKPMLVTLPCVLLLLDYWPLGRFVRVGAARLVAEKLPLLAVCVASAVVTVVAQQGTGSVAAADALPLDTRVANAVVAYVRYADQTVRPTRMTPYYPYNVRGLTHPFVLGIGGALLAVTAAAVLLRRSRPYVLVGWLWFVGTLVPVIGLVQVGGQGRADRYTYVPAVGLTVALVWGAADLIGPARRRAAAVAAGGAAATLAAVTWGQVGRWENSVTLWEYTIAVTGADNWMAETNLAHALTVAGREAEAAAHLGAVARLRPDSPTASFDHAALLAKLGRDDEAVPALERTLALTPGHQRARQTLGLILARQNRPGAFEHLLAARGGPRAEVDARVEFGAILLDRGYIPEAREQLGLAAGLDPADPKTRFLLGTACLFVGKFEDAEAALRATVRLVPGDPAALDLLGLVLWKRGAAAEAVGFLRRAVAADPKSATLRADYALALGAAGNPDDARREYGEATARDPGWAAAALTAATDAVNGGKPGVSLFLHTCRLREACEATGFRNTESVVTLAEALAVDGEFKEAEAALAPLRAEFVKTGQTKLVEAVDAYVQKYRAGKSVRSPQP